MNQKVQVPTSATLISGVKEDKFSFCRFVDSKLYENDYEK